MTHMNRFARIALGLGLVLSQLGTHATTSPTATRDLIRDPAPKLQIQADGRTGQSLVAMMKESPMCTYLLHALRRR